MISYREARSPPDSFHLFPETLDLKRSSIERKRVRTRVHLEVRDILRALVETEKSALIQGKKVEQPCTVVG